MSARNTHGIVHHGGCGRAEAANMGDERQGARISMQFSEYTGKDMQMNHVHGRSLLRRVVPGVVDPICDSTGCQCQR